MTFWTPSTTTSATVPTPASAGSRQAAEPKSLCVCYISCCHRGLKRRSSSQIGPRSLRITPLSPRTIISLPSSRCAELRAFHASLSSPLLVLVWLILLRYLPLSPSTSPYLPVSLASPRISRISSHLPVSPRISPYLPVSLLSPGISRYLPVSPGRHTWPAALHRAMDATETELCGLPPASFLES